MTGRIQRDETEAMTWGKRLQPVIFAALADDGYDVWPFEEASWHDAARPWLVGHPDGFGQGDLSDVVVDAKASARGYDSPQLHYQAQLQAYLHLGNARRGMLATLSGLHLQVDVLERSDHEIELLLALAERFMEYVYADAQPPPLAHPDDRAAVLQLHPNAEPRKVRETREVRDARRELRALLEAEAARKERIDHLRAVVTNHMGAAATLIDAHDNEVATWKNVTSRRMDTKRLKAEAPDVWERYALPNTTRRLLVP